MLEILFLSIVSMFGVSMLIFSVLFVIISLGLFCFEAYTFFKGYSHIFSKNDYIYFILLFALSFTYIGTSNYFHKESNLVRTTTIKEYTKFDLKKQKDSSKVVIKINNKETIVLEHNGINIDNVKDSKLIIKKESCNKILASFFLIEDKYSYSFEKK